MALPIRITTCSLILIVAHATTTWSQTSALTISQAYLDPVLLRLDLTSGETEEIGPLGLPGFDALQALAFLPSGQLIGVDITGKVVLVEPTTGEGTLVGDLGTTFYPYNLDLAADASGRLWMLVNGHDIESYLWRLDPTAGTGELLGAPPTVISGLAACGEQLYGLALEFDPIAARIVQIDTETLSVTEVAEVDDWASVAGVDLDFDSGGGLASLGHRSFGIPGSGQFLQRFDLAGRPIAPPLGPGPLGRGLAIAAPPGECLSGSPLPIPIASPIGLAGLAMLLVAAGILILSRRSTV